MWKKLLSFTEKKNPCKRRIDLGERVKKRLRTSNLTQHLLLVSETLKIYCPDTFFPSLIPQIPFQPKNSI